MKQVAANPKRRRLRLTIVLALALAGLGVGGYFFWTYVVQSNFAVVVPGKIYRSGQPSPGQLDKWVHQYGIKTVINLRGDKLQVCKDEGTQAQKLNVKFYPLALSARRLVSKDSMKSLIDTLDNAPQPILLHCQGGNDRSGFVSMLAMLAFGHTDYKTAKAQLRIPLTRWGKNQQHISDTIAMYEEYCGKNKLDPNSYQQFKDWALKVYNPDPKEVENPQQPE